MIKKERLSVMNIPLDELYDAAKEFHQAGKETDALVLRLGERMKKLEASWLDAGQQAFFQYYHEWQPHMGGFAAILLQIAAELEAIADRYSEADR
jgi:WXG100 family type VII secretion target